VQNENQAWSGRFKSGLWAQRVRIGTRSWDVNMRVLHCNTIRMRLVGALAATFLFRGTSKTKEGFRREVERSGFMGRSGAGSRSRKQV